MVSVESPVSQRLTTTALLLLTFATGLVDPVSVLVLGHVFVANMTGNVIFLGFWFVPNSGVDLIAAVVAFTSFVVGTIIGGRLARHLDNKVRRGLLIALGCDAVVLLALSVIADAGVLSYHGQGRLLLIAALAVTFGVQTVTARQFGVQELSTTVLTQTIVGLGLGSRLAGGTGQREVLRYTVVLTMCGGAAVGATLTRFTVAPIIAIAALAVAVSAAISCSVRSGRPFPTVSLTRMPSVLVTGAASGIGSSMAEYLAARNWDVIAGVRTQQDADAVTAANPQRVTAVVLDVIDDDHLDALAGSLPTRLDAVVNNAGVAVSGPMEAVTTADWRKKLQVNVIGQLAVTRAVPPRIRASRGRIVFISSANGQVPMPMLGAYCASKFALEVAADAVRMELHTWGIRVVVVEPERRHTDMWRTADAVVEETEAALTPDLRAL